MEAEAPVDAAEERRNGVIHDVRLQAKTSNGAVNIVSWTACGRRNIGKTLYHIEFAEELDFFSFSGVYYSPLESF